jgi:3-deoxy-D-manno-octulosonic-acid transferase
LSLRSALLGATGAAAPRLPLQHRFAPGLSWWFLYLAWRLAWVCGLPVALAWLWRRGRREPAYRQHLGQRLGLVPCRGDRPVWVHAASLGELRGIAPLVHELCAAGVPVRLTTLTPAGRQAAAQLFGPQQAAGRLDVVYAPLELAHAVARFIARTGPRCAVMVENDTWPVLLVQARRGGLPAAMVNAQYSERSLQRDARFWGFRTRLFGAYDLVLAKSERHAARFRAAGSGEVVVAGETRFDVPLPQAQIEAAARLAQAWGLGPGGRPVFAVASAVQGEEALWLDALEALRGRCRAGGGPAPLFVLVPRSPQRFDAVAQQLQARGWQFVRRSRCLDAALRPRPAPAPGGVAVAPPGPDDAPGAAVARGDPAGAGSADGPPPELLLGDSLGEMFFYLALADVVAVGGSFLPTGSHNVIEPLALGKPVVVGPVTWTIEFPAVEALQAGVLHQAASPEALVGQVFALLDDGARAGAARQAAADFCSAHRGAAARHRAHLLRWMPAA